MQCRSSSPCSQWHSFAKSQAVLMMSSPWISQANQLCKIETKLHVTCNAGVSDHDLMFSKKAEDSGMQRGEHWPEPLDSRQAARPPLQSAVRQRMATAAGNFQLLLYAAFVPHVVLVPSDTLVGHTVFERALADPECLQC